MELKSFATPEQMEQRSQGMIPADTPFLEMALRAASKRIREHCGWHIAETFQTLYKTRRGDGHPLWLPSLHLRSIDSLVVDGRLVDLTETPVDFVEETGETDIRGRNIRVTFTHGFESVPEDLVDLTLMVASRAMGSPLGFVREQAGGVAVTHSVTAAGVAGGTVLLDVDKETLLPYTLGWQP